MSSEFDIETLISAAQEGSHEARNELIRRYSPFIIKTVSKNCGRFVKMGEDDEVSIGMMAFDEAVLSYRGKSGASFLSYSELVMRHRLIDFFRSQKRNKYTVSIDEVRESQLAVEDEDISKAIVREDLRREITSLASEISLFRISFKDLIESSPKHRETRQNAILTAMNIAANELMLKSLHAKRSLPQKEITEHFHVSVKLLERYRKYIIAVTLIFAGEYEGLQSFIRGGVANGCSK